MRQRPGITLTGADEQTPLEGLCALAERPGVGIGILFSLSPEGRNRYPSVEWIEGAVAVLGKRCAIHVCGRKARKAVLAREYPWLSKVGRAQINGKLKYLELFRALKIFDEVITQFSGGPGIDVITAADISPRHSILVDASGGRGIAPLEWTRPNAGKRVGFAGGLGPDNLAEELPKIAAVARDRWWIDMETSLRSEYDWFDLSKAHKCIDLLEEWWSHAG